LIRTLSGIILLLFSSAATGQNFGGNWTVSGPAVIDPLTLEITWHPDSFYLVKGYHYTPEPSWYGEGLEAFGYFAFALGIDVPGVHAYKMQDSALSGLAIGYKGEELYAEGSGDVAGFRASDVNLRGTWIQVKAHGEKEITLTLERNEDVHPAVFVATLSNGEETKGGYGVVFDEVLVVGVLGEAGRIISVLHIEDNILNGNWLESRWIGADYESREFDTGTVKLERIKE